MRAPASRLVILGLAAWRVCAQEALYFLDVEKVVCSSTSLSLNIWLPGNSNAATPYVPAFYRTSKAQVDVAFSLTDNSGKTIATSGMVALQAHARRLAAPEENPLCEQVFLADGREPVDLPDTWAEAHSGFRNICERDGAAEALDCAAAAAELFAGQPQGEEAFRPRGDFCTALARYLLEVHGHESLDAQQRRLKGGTGSYSSSSSGTRAIGGWDSKTRTDMAPYGYTASRMGAAFPRGYATTPYGYSSVGGSAPLSSRGRTVAVAQGSFLGFTAWRWYGRSGKNTTQCVTLRDECDWDASGEELVRDDLMDFGFLPSEMSYPLKLRVMSVSGADLTRERICSPEDWDNMTSELPTTRRDLFFSIVPVEELEEDPELRWLGLLAIIPLCMCCLAAVIWRKALRRRCCCCRR